MGTATGQRVSGPTGGKVTRKLLMGALGFLAAVTLPLFATTPALAYGAANWQLTFSGTGPGFGSGDGATWPVARPSTPAWRPRAPPETVNSLNTSTSPGFSRAPAR